MKVLSSKEAEEKLVSWKRSHTSVKLVLTGIKEIACSDVVAIWDVDVIRHAVQLTGGTTGYFFMLDDALITGDEDFLDITYPNIRYLLERSSKH